MTDAAAPADHSLGPRPWAVAGYRHQHHPGCRGRRVPHHPFDSRQAARSIRAARLAGGGRARPGRQHDLGRTRGGAAVGGGIVPLPFGMLRPTDVGPTDGISVCVANPHQRAARSRFRVGGHRPILDRPQSRVQGIRQRSYRRRGSRDFGGTNARRLGWAIPIDRVRVWGLDPLSALPPGCYARPAERDPPDRRGGHHRLGDLGGDDAVRPGLGVR